MHPPPPDAQSCGSPGSDTRARQPEAPSRTGLHLRSSLSVFSLWVLPSKPSRFLELQPGFSDGLRFLNINHVARVVSCGKLAQCNDQAVELSCKILFLLFHRFKRSIAARDHRPGAARVRDQT